jgi:hypothetical protein
MRKTLLIAACALAASVISSQAQVYSQNIVGYVNLPLNGGYNLIENPLSTGATNGLNEIFPNVQDGDTFLKFNGVGYDQVLYSPFWQGIYGQPTPWLDANTFTSVPIPTFAPGTGFFYYNAGASNTVTLTGSVKMASTNGLSGAYNMVGSVLPVGGSVTNVIWNLQPNDGDVYLTYNGSGYAQVLYSPFWQSIYSQPTPWLDPNTFTTVPAPSLSVGQGFFYYNSVSTNSWVQILSQ